MPLFSTHVRNSEFRTRDDGVEHDTAEAALASGVRSAVVMASDEIGRGHRSAAIEVNIESEDGTLLLTSVVAVSVSPLMAAEGGAGERPLEGDTAQA